MRTMIISISILLVACSSWTEPPPYQLTVVLDRSNKHLVQTVIEDTPELIKALGLEHDPWGAVDFRLVLISGVAYNRSEELHLSAEDPDDGNFMVRKRKVEGFTQHVAELLRFYATEARDEDASAIYLPLATELERLSTCKHCRDRQLIIYSDLVEHKGEGQWSLYDPILADSLRDHPEAFMRYFGRQRSLPDLSGIHCTVVNIPHNPANSDRVSTLYAFYEQMIESKGATMEITGNFHFRPMR